MHIYRNREDGNEKVGREKRRKRGMTGGIRSDGEDERKNFGTESRTRVFLLFFRLYSHKSLNRCSPTSRVETETEEETDIRRVETEAALK